MIQQFYFCVCVCINKSRQDLEETFAHPCSLLFTTVKEATQMSIKGLMDKDNVVYAKNGLCGLKGKFIICFKVNEPKNFMLSESHESEKDEYHYKRM